MGDIADGNWTVLVTSVIGVLVVLCGALLKIGYSNIVRRLDDVIEQTADLPAIRNQLRTNSDRIAAHNNSIRDLFRTKADRVKT